MRIGVAVTTHNRPDCLRLTMDQFQKCHTIVDEYVVVDDDSRNDNAWDACIDLKIPITYIKTSGRVGVARAKNHCLKNLGKCDHYFLFDDDCFPIAAGWEKWVIDQALRTKQHHFIYNLPGAMRVMRVQAEYDGVQAFQTGTGVFMYLSKKAVDKLGGFNVNYGVWGHEHNGYSMRCHNAGLCAYPFQSPVGLNNFLYSLDMQGMNYIARQYMTKFTSSEPHELRNIWAKQSQGCKALEYDVTHNYYQPL